MGGLGLDLSFWIGTVIGTALGYVVPKLIDFLGVRARGGLGRSAKRFHSIIDTTRLVSRVLGHYPSETRMQSGIYTDDSWSGGVVRLPFLAPSQALAARRIDDLGELRTLLVIDSQAQPAPKRRRPLGTGFRVLLGKRVFEAPTLRFVRTIYSADTLPSVLCTRSTFLRCVRTWFRLEDASILDTFARRNLTRFRQRDFASFDVAARSPSPKMVGGSVALFFTPQAGQMPEVLVASASPEVAGTTSGSHTLVPSFAYIPMRESVDFSILELNVLRELGEELFDLEELETYYSKPAVNPGWFTDSRAITAITESLHQGRSRYWYLSSGFNALNGTFEIHLALELADETHLREVMDGAVGNWEIARGDDSSTLEFVPLDSDRLTEWFADGDMHAGGAVAICQLRSMFLTYPS